MIRARETHGCTVAVELSGYRCIANVEVDGDPVIRPGDRVRVNGAPVRLAFGEKLTLRRTATIVRATLVERLWTRLWGHTGMDELYEVSFSSGRAL